MKIHSKLVKIREKQKGFSLIEMTVAIGILITALLSALALATFGVVAGGESKMRVTAINLAREGVEVVRNVRDSNWLEEEDWLKDIPKDGDGFEPFIVENDIPDFDPTTNAWKLYGWHRTFSPGNPSTYDVYQVFRDTTGTLYLQGLQADAAKPTNFYRALDVVKVSENELKVTCYVAYQERGRWYLVNVEDHLFNWY